MNHPDLLYRKHGSSKVAQWFPSICLKRAIICSTMIIAFAGTVLGSDLPVITSFAQNGLLVASNMQPGTISSVEWAASPEGPWHTQWTNLAGVKVDSNSTITVSVPMFYRLRGVPRVNNPTNAEGMRLIPSGSFTMGKTPDYDSGYDVFVSAFYMDPTEVTRSLWSSVYHWATNNGYHWSTNSPLKNVPIVAADVSPLQFPLGKRHKIEPTHVGCYFLNGLLTVIVIIMVMVAMMVLETAFLILSNPPIIP